MKFVVLLDMFFELLAKQKVSAPYFAQKYEVSVRTVYRYVDRLSMVVPLYVKTGRNGGIFLPETYKLPKGFFTQADYEAAIEALSIAYEQSSEERFLTAQRKLFSQMRAELKTTSESEKFDLPLSEAITGNKSKRD